jgi:hypothetical protein
MADFTGQLISGGMIRLDAATVVRQIGRPGREGPFPLPSVGLHVIHFMAWLFSMWQFSGHHGYTIAPSLFTGDNSGSVRTGHRFLTAR